MTYRLNYYPYQFAVCTMFKNEAPRIKEWLDYHINLGAEHFYLYDNESTDNIHEVLFPYIDSGIVELIKWPSVKKNGLWGIDDNTFVPYQLGAFNNCIKKKALGKAQWLAIIDVDEYIVPTEGKKAFISLLEEGVRQKVGSYELHWLVFGTSNVWEIPKGEKLTKYLVYRSELSHPWNKLTKSIHRPEAVNTCWVHIAENLHKGYKKKMLSIEKFRIHHYWTGPEKRLLEKRGSSKSNKYNTEFNMVYDPSIMHVF